MATRLVRPRRQIGAVITSPGLEVGIAFDATISEDYRDGVQLTRHPVEDGADISDHIQTLPKEVTLEGIISNTPLVESQRFPDRADTKYQQLRNLLESRQQVTIVTGLRLYRNMILESIGLSRKVPAAQDIRPVLKFVELVIVSPQTVQVPDLGVTEEASGEREVANEDAIGDEEVGRQNPVAADPQVSRRGGSVLARVFSR